MVRDFTEEEKSLVSSVIDGTHSLTGRIPCIDELMVTYMMETDAEMQKVIEATYLKLASMTDQEYAAYDFHVEYEDPFEAGGGDVHEGMDT